MRNQMERREQILRKSLDPSEMRNRLLSLWKGGGSEDMRKAFEQCLKTDPRTSGGRK